LGQTVVTSPLVPVRIRQSLNVESGLNDGIALPLVLLLASFAGAVEGEGNTSYWVRFALLQLTLGPAVGGAVGYAGGHLLARTRSWGWSNPVFEKLALLAFAVLAFSGAELAGGNGFIAAFVAGLTIGNTARGLCESLHEFGEAEGQLLTLLVFVIFGAFLLPPAIAHAQLATLGYALASLTVVRMLPVALSLWGSGLRAQSVMFLGWFGPRGLASILFALLVIEEGRLASSQTFEAVVMLTVALSTLLHGVSAYPLAKRYGAFVAGLGRDQHPEHEDALELPTRTRAWHHRPTVGGES
jgi:NhaP-type Na+/H+ or K+/H+ antiporter